MDFFCFHRDRDGSFDLRMELLEEHWSYMDRFADRLVVRGPTFDAHGTPTGSVHVVDLESRERAWSFAFGEPGYRAGAYRDVVVRRWSNLLGRTMWEYPGSREPDDLVFVLGFSPRPDAVGRVTVPDADLVMFGPMLTDDAQHRVGTVAIGRPGGSGPVGLLGADAHVAVEVRPWTFGGRR